MKTGRKLYIASFMALALTSLGVQATTNLLTETQKLTAYDRAPGDFFGNSVAISCPYAVVGVDGDDDDGARSGSAYIYKLVGTTWVQHAKLTASDAAANDRFGCSVSISGNKVVVGARWDDDAGSDSGAAYLYELDGTTWVETKLTASDAAGDDNFGSSVSISGNKVVVGVRLDDDAGYNSGSAYVYELDGTTWVETAKLTASDAATSDWFGTSVSISDNKVVVGARGDDTDGGPNSGSAYLYELDGTTWVETAKLTASDAAASDDFGTSVSISGNKVVVGAWLDDDAGYNSGAAYVYELDGTTWVETAKLTASDGTANGWFGHSVSISANKIVVGALWGEDTASGSAYLYELDGTTWVETAKLIASDPNSNDNFGSSVALSDGCAIAIGVPNDDSARRRAGSGSVYLFELNMNMQPVANAGGPYVADATGWLDTQVWLDGLGSTDPDGDALTYAWDLNLAFDSNSNSNYSDDVDATAATSVHPFPIGQTEISLVVTDEAGLASEPDVTTVTISYVSVAVDIKPGNAENSINMGSQGVIPVAFLSDAYFDATTINPLTVTLRGEDFGDGLVKLRGKKDVKPMASFKDVNGDGIDDLLVHLETEKLSAYGVDAVCVLGALTYDGYVVSGSDIIRVVPE